jgi:hypothetical protein
MSHRTSAAVVALRLTGERPGTAAMPSARGFAKDFVGRWRIVEMEVTATSSILSKRGVSPSRASPMANPLLGLSRASWTCATDRPAPSSHAAESPFCGKLLSAAGAAAAELSNRRNAALSRARAAKYPHPGILSLRHLPSHCDERLAHECDIGRRARYRNDA